MVLGREIVEREVEKKYGSGFYNSLSKDLRKLLPEVSGFGSSNLMYMAKFYLLYLDVINLPQVVGDLEEENFPQVVGNFEVELFSVPWGHHRLIIDRCKNDSEKAIFFVKKIIQNNWSRAVLENFLDTDLYERQGKAISNFEYSLPAPQSDLAQEITRR